MTFYVSNWRRKLLSSLRPNVLETGSRVTALATLTESALMDVAFLMASNTGRWRIDLVAIIWLLMAIQALGLLVRTINLVLGALVVVEIPSLPIACVVAAVALLA